MQVVLDVLVNMMMRDVVSDGESRRRSAPRNSHHEKASGSAAVPLVGAPQVAVA